MRELRLVVRGMAIAAVLALAGSAVAAAAVHREPIVRTALAASCGTDEFAGSALDDARWDVLRPAGAGPVVAGGKLNLELRNGDLINQTANAENVVLQDAPAGGWTATTKFNIASIDAQGEQAGIVLWKSEAPNAFGKIMFIQTVDANTRVIESIWTDDGGLAAPIADSRAAVPALPANADVLMRLRSDGSLLTAEFSTDDGATWTKAGQTASYGGDLRVGLVAIQGAQGNGGTVPFERFDLECAPQVTASATSGTAPFEVNLTGTGAPDGADLGWDFGDGETAAGGVAQTHTFDEPGTYRVRLTATTAGRRVTGSTVVTVAPALAPCLTPAEDFGGNELDSRWQVLRPRLTGLSVSGGSLRLQPYGGDMHGTNASARNVLLQPAPAGAWTATTKIDVSRLTVNGEQAGLLVWRSEAPNNFAKIVFNRRSATEFWVERQNNVDGATEPGGGNAGLVTPVPNDVYIRVSSDGADTPRISAAYSVDGSTWTPVQGSFAVGGSGELKIGIGRWGSGGLRAAAFDYLRVVSADPASDEFDGSALDRCKWPQLLREDATKYRVREGNLELDTTAGEIDEDETGPEASNLIGQPAPPTPWQATAKIEVDTDAEGQQAGLLYHRGNGNWLKAVLVDKGATSQIELVRVKDGNYILDPPFKVDVPKDLTQLFLRLKSNGVTGGAEYSTDGTSWTPVGTPRDVSDLAGGQIGPLALHGGAAQGVTAKFDFVNVEPVAAECTAPGDPEEGFTRIWNGTDLSGWRQAGPGGFEIVDDGAEGCRLLSQGGLGMLWYERQQYDEFVLRMQWKTEDATDNSGVFVRFPNPGNDPAVAINNGHEIQVREGVEGDGENQKTGSIYNFDREDARAAKPAGEWNDYEIRFEDSTYTVTLNGTVVNTWRNTSDQGRTPGYVGIQNHGDLDKVSYRNLRIQALNEVQPNLFDTIGITRLETRQNSGIFGTPTRYSLPAEEMPPSGTVGAAPDDDFDNVRLRMPDTSGTVPNLAAFHGQTLELREVDRKQYSKIHFFGTTTDGGPAGGDFVLRFSDDSTQTINVQFRDWCAPQDSADHHVAIGPLSKRWRETGEDGAQCAIYHVPKELTAGKTLVSVTLPSSTTPGNPPIQAYLMALTLEDASGEFETPDLSGSLEFPDDQTPPVTTHTIAPAQPDGSNGWYRRGVTLTLAAADAPGGSNVVRATQYRINGGPPQEYSGPVQLTTEGALRVEYRSIDGAGNAEDFKPVTVKVDATAPATTAELRPDRPFGAAGWFDAAVEVTLIARDGTGSGASRVEYRIGTGAWQRYGGPFTVSQDGAIALSYRSTDAAGNAEAVKQRQLRIDDSAPVTTARLQSASPAAGGVHRAPVTVTLSASDGTGSGLTGTQYRLDGGAWQAYRGPFAVSALGGHLVEYRSADRAGNLETPKEQTFAIVSRQGGRDDAPEPEPFVGLAPRRRPLAVGQLLRGVEVRAVCVGVGRGKLTLAVTRKVARRLGLRGTTLASRSVRCGGDSRLSVRLKPRASAKRALRRARGSFTATLRLRMSGAGGAVSDQVRLTLRGGRS